MTNRFKGTPNRYRNNRPPAPKMNIPIVRTIDGAMSYIAKHRAFTAPKLHWEDRDSEGNLIAEAYYNIYGKHTTSQGIVKGYLLHNYVANSDFVESTMIEMSLFYWDKLTDQWYRNQNNPEALDHPLEPCVPPEKSIIDLSAMHMRFLMRTSVMDLMQAKVNGSFNNSAWFSGFGDWSSAGDFIVNPIYIGTQTGRNKP